MTRKEEERTKYEAKIQLRLSRAKTVLDEISYWVRYSEHATSDEIEGEIRLYLRDALGALDCRAKDLVNLISERPR